MKKQRLAVRTVAGLATAGIIVMGALTAPAQADTGWNRGQVHTSTVKVMPGTVTISLDTGWN